MRQNELPSGCLAVGILILLVTGVFFRCTQRRPVPKAGESIESLVPATDLCHTAFSSHSPSLDMQLDTLFRYVQEWTESNTGIHDDTGSFNLIIDSLTHAWKPGFDTLTSPRQRIDLFCSHVFEQLGIVFDSTCDEAAALFPRTVLHQRRGECMGISLLLLILGNRLSLPLYGVVVPGHIFVRYDNGTFTRNLEPNRACYSYTNKRYRRVYGVSDDSWYTLENLTWNGVKACFCYNVGIIAKDRGFPHRAICWFTRAEELLPGFPEALGNRGITLHEVGKTEQGLSDLVRVRETCPSLRGLERNIGTLQLHENNNAEALQSFKRGIRYYPEEPALWFGLGVAAYRLGKTTEAREALERTLSLDTGHEEAAELLELIAKRK